MAPEKVYKISNFYIKASLVFSIITFIGFILSLMVFNQNLWFISIAYLLVSGILLVVFKLSKYSEVIVYEDKFEKKSYFNSKQISWSCVENIFEEISSNYPQNKIGHIKIYSKDNDLTTINSYFDNFDNIQKTIKEKTLDYIGKSLEKQLSDNKAVNFFYSRYYKKTYIIFTGIAFILITLQIIFVPVGFIAFLFAILLAYGLLKLIRSFSTIQISNNEIIANSVLNKKRHKFSDIKKISVRGNEGYRNIVKIVFADNSKVKIESKISNYWILLQQLTMRTNLTMEKI